MRRAPDGCVACRWATTGQPGSPDQLVRSPTARHSPPASRTRMHPVHAWSGTVRIRTRRVDGATSWPRARGRRHALLARAAECRLDPSRARSHARRDPQRVRSTSASAGAGDGRTDRSGSQPTRKEAHRRHRVNTRSGDAPHARAVGRCARAASSTRPASSTSRAFPPRRHGPRSTTSSAAAPPAHAPATTAGLRHAASLGWWPGLTRDRDARSPDVSSAVENRWTAHGQLHRASPAPRAPRRGAPSIHRGARRPGESFRRARSHLATLSTCPPPLLLLSLSVILTEAGEPAGRAASAGLGAPSAALRSLLKDRHAGAVCPRGRPRPRPERGGGPSVDPRARAQRQSPSREERTHP
jgi:hypothetical protein